MIWYKPDNIIFKNRKEAKKYFGTNKYYKIERVHIPEHTRSLSGSLLGYKTIP